MTAADAPQPGEAAAARERQGDTPVEAEGLAPEGGAAAAAQPAAAKPPERAEASRNQPAADPKKDKEPLVAIGAVIKGKWRVLQKLGHGAFGETYAASEHPPPQNSQGEQVAIKVERASSGGAGERNTKAGDVLRTEVVALKKLQSCDYVVRYKSSGQDSALNINFLVMERLSFNLADLKKRAPGGMFQWLTIVRVGLDMLGAISGVHELGFIHRDIKPSNFVVGTCLCSRREGCTPGAVGCSDPGCQSARVFLIDFGLARRYLMPDDHGVKTHRPPRKKAGFRGTARYASVNSHEQLELSRRDDLWSLFYVLVEFSLERGLPWRGERDKDLIWEKKKAELHDEQGRLRTRDSPSPSQLLAPLPEQFSAFMEHLDKLSYEARPDYAYLQALLREVGEQKGDLTLGAALPIIEWQHPDWGQQRNSQRVPSAHAPPPPAAAVSLPRYADAAAADLGASARAGNAHPPAPAPAPAPAAVGSASVQDVQLLVPPNPSPTAAPAHGPTPTPAPALPPAPPAEPPEHAKSDHDSSSREPGVANAPSAPPAPAGDAQPGAGHAPGPGSEAKGLGVLAEQGDTAVPVLDKNAPETGDGERRRNGGCGCCSLM